MNDANATESCLGGRETPGDSLAAALQLRSDSETYLSLIKMLTQAAVFVKCHAANDLENEP